MPSWTRDRQKRWKLLRRLPGRLAQVFHHALEVLRQRCPQIEFLAGNRMREHEVLRMQHHSLRLLRQPLVRLPPVQRIAEDWMAKRFEMHADLMRPPGENLAAQQRGDVAK